MIFITDKENVRDMQLAEVVGEVKPMSRRRKGFTLIELLVVIAIIAILASLLMPALRRARDLSKLVVCSSNQRQIAIGAMLYTADNDGFYPLRQGVQANSVASRPGILRYAPGGWDDRPHIAAYIDLNRLVCPFSASSDLLAADDNYVESTYSFYFGFRAGPSYRKISKPGDTMNFAGNEFDLLVADRYSFYDGDIISSHPGTSASDLEYQGPFGASWGWRGSTFGAMNRNYIRGDGSGFRISNLTPLDPRLEKFPYRSGYTGVGTRFTELPTTDYTP